MKDNPSYVPSVLKNKPLKQVNRNVEEKLSKFISHLESIGYRNISNILSNFTNKTKVTAIDKYNYKYELKIEDWYSSKTHQPISGFNPYSIYNINIYLTSLGGEYVCISNKYINNKALLKFKHVKCGLTFDSSWVNILRRVQRASPFRIELCDKCTLKSVESKHAIILKQIWIHDYPDTTVEDKSFINPNTGKVMPTDIVNHRKRIAIEVQSEYHDHRKDKDLLKKNYWESRGYNFYSPDIRDYSIIEMVQLFFPTIKELPDYVSLQYDDVMDLIKVQHLLNEGYSIPEISKITNYKKRSIYHALKAKQLYYPKGYVNGCHTPIVQLDLLGRYVSSYKSLKKADEQTGVSRRNISSALSKNNYSSGYFWFKEKDYESGNYKITVTKKTKALINKLYN